MICFIHAFDQSDSNLFMQKYRFIFFFSREMDQRYNLHFTLNLKKKRRRKDGVQ